MIADLKTVAILLPVVYVFIVDVVGDLVCLFIVSIFIVSSALFLVSLLPSLPIVVCYLSPLVHAIAL